MAPKSQPDRPFCACSKPVRLCYFVKKDHPRHRDRYWGCPERSCEHFEWVDPCPKRTTSSQDVQSSFFTYKQKSGEQSLKSTFNTVQKNGTNAKSISDIGNKYSLNNDQEVRTSTQGTQNEPSSLSASLSSNVVPKENAVFNALFTSTSISLEKLYNTLPSDEKFGKKYNYPIKVTFSLDDDEHFIVRGYHHVLKEYWRTRKGASYDSTRRGWIIPMTEYENSVKELKGYEKLPTTIAEISGYVEKAIEFRAAKPRVDECEVKERIGSLWEALLPHQKEGVIEAISRNGRVLLGDDMGLGKTIQALAIAEYYKDDGKVLVICPASVAGNWQVEIKKWVGAKDEEIWFVRNGKEVNQDHARFTIISYELAKRRQGWIGRFQIVIADESHSLKDRQSERTKKLSPLMRKSKRVVLLSGTPAESRPVELFAQINIVAPLLFPNYDQYIKRFCGGEKKINRDGREYIDTKDAKNTEELHWLLNSTVLIRRKKEDVNLNLPSKTRQIIHVEIPATSKRELRDLKERAKVDKRANFLKLYEESGRAKVPAIQDYLLSLKDDYKKYIVFGHHKDVLDQICYVLRKDQIRFIRIDGQTDVRLRQDFVEKFQNEREIKFAVLSLTAASTGLNLQSADGVIFAELSWNPSTLAQGENRAHRIGRIGDVEIKYIIAKDTLDLVQWQMLKKKSKVLGIIFDNEDSIPLDEISEEDYWMIEAFDKEMVNQVNEMNTAKSEGIKMDSDIIVSDENKEMVTNSTETLDNNSDENHVPLMELTTDSIVIKLGDDNEKTATNPAGAPTNFDMMADNLDWDFDKDLSLNYLEVDNNVLSKNSTFTLMDGGMNLLNENPIVDFKTIADDRDQRNLIQVKSITNPTFIVLDDEKAEYPVKHFNDDIDNQGSQEETFKDHSIINILDDDDFTAFTGHTNDQDSTLMTNHVKKAESNGKPDRSNASSSSERPAFRKKYKNELDSLFDQRYNISGEISTKQENIYVSNVLLFTDEFANGTFNPRRNLSGSRNKRNSDVYAEESQKCDKESKKIRLETDQETSRTRQRITTTYIDPTQVTDFQVLSQVKRRPRKPKTYIRSSNNAMK
ncbi:9268_t:CDS:1 [Funneliformis geosporum]|uniref:8362_t:CDS:1 n=1 Tax=Funneliformis geosporum TaxID=1117311 RepID=A0A9W4WMQ9_9GLOM|nr:8362_t:CDS:1 [Funneliformis geosporum]CAI2165925.1 9268_t:CDS:1 [Funneliformis geosporum]